MVSRLVNVVKRVTQQLGGGGAKAPALHEDPLEAPPAQRGGVVIAPEHPDPSWPTPKYYGELFTIYTATMRAHPEIAEAHRQEQRQAREAAEHLRAQRLERERISGVPEEQISTFPVVNARETIELLGQRYNVRYLQLLAQKGDVALHDTLEEQVRQEPNRFPELFGGELGGVDFSFTYPELKIALCKKLK